MNLFYLDSDPRLCAEAHVDKHVVKMPIEAAQALSTILRTRASIDYGYKLAYVNHPVTKWVGQNINNFAWAHSLGLALCAEYSYRYGRVHATELVLKGMIAFLDRLQNVLSDEPFCEPPKCVSPEMKHLSTIEAYRAYYRITKARLHRWTDREPPSWIGEVK